MEFPKFNVYDDSDETAELLAIHRIGQGRDVRKINASNKILAASIAGGVILGLVGAVLTERIDSPSPIDIIETDE